MGEVWKKVENTSDCYISNLGRFKKNKKIITPWTDNKGYMRVYIGQGKSEKVHRLVAKSFIKNPENKPQVDHINTIKSDNRVLNLRWVTNKENANNENSKNKYKNKRSLGNNANAKKVMNITTGEIFSSATEASLSVGNYKSGVIEAIYRNRKYHGSLWKYI